MYPVSQTRNTPVEDSDETLFTPPNTPSLSDLPPELLAIAKVPTTHPPRQLPLHHPAQRTSDVNVLHDGPNRAIPAAVPLPIVAQAGPSMRFFDDQVLIAGSQRHPLQRGKGQPTDPLQLVEEPIGDESFLGTIDSILELLQSPDNLRRAPEEGQGPSGSRIAAPNESEHSADSAPEVKSSEGKRKRSLGPEQNSSECNTSDSRQKRRRVGHQQVNQLNGEEHDDGPLPKGEVAIQKIKKSQNHPKTREYWSMKEAERRRKNADCVRALTTLFPQHILGHPPAGKKWTKTDILTTATYKIMQGQQNLIQEQHNVIEEQQRELRRRAEDIHGSTKWSGNGSSKLEAD
ncbi:hypothetical protein JAAARDRAFT_189518 [Jaapia argillacea MUCL 33604]|uniref:Uncharacterized protein n=1 Tax=Jaapia argillacea MUCL 33604 TaxID=933084 RepID=A0A067QF68_9AGAM|nr:hypothetical protein JAAARDRAFT_189518 [Jaapia argillacea MUCL 33604]